MDATTSQWLRQIKLFINHNYKIQIKEKGKFPCWNPSKQTRILNHVKWASDMSDSEERDSKKSSRRFFNSSLKEVYDLCLLPTEVPFSAEHTIPANQYSVYIERRSAWNQTIYTPPQAPHNVQFIHLHELHMVIWNRMTSRKLSGITTQLPESWVVFSGSHLISHQQQSGWIALQICLQPEKRQKG